MAWQGQGYQMASRVTVHVCVCVFEKNGGRGAHCGPTSARMRSSSSQSYLQSNNQSNYWTEAFPLCSADISWIIQAAAKGRLKAGKCIRVTRRNVSQSASDLGHTCLICCVWVWAMQSTDSVAQIGLNNDASVQEKRLNWSNLHNMSRSARWGASLDDLFLRFGIRESSLACPNLTPLDSFPHEATTCDVLSWFFNTNHCSRIFKFYKIHHSYSSLDPDVFILDTQRLHTFSLNI